MSDAEFRRLVASMRRWQRQWFGGDKSSATLNRCKYLEMVVDQALAEREQGQLSLFTDPEPGEQGPYGRGG